VTPGDKFFLWLALSVCALAGLVYWLAGGR
jgi:hypothetical protein